MKIPTLYKKLIDLCRERSNSRNEINANVANSELAARFRLSQQEVREAMRELEEMEVIERKNRLVRKIRLP